MVLQPERQAWHPPPEWPRGYLLLGRALPWAQQALVESLVLQALPVLELQRPVFQQAARALPSLLRGPLEILPGKRRRPSGRESLQGYLQWKAFSLP